MAYLLLEYDLVYDYLERRPPLRDEHLGLLRAATDEGQFALGGALQDPTDRAVLVWTADRAVVEDFIARDPYVREGLVRSWTIRDWNVVIGKYAE